MRAFSILMLGSFLVFIFPWIAALYRRHYFNFSALFMLWIAGSICAIFLWFGIGVAIIVGSGVLATLLTTLNLDSDSVDTGGSRGA